jgi:hypothetical protein
VTSPKCLHTIALALPPSAFTRLCDMTLGISRAPLCKIPEEYATFYEGNIAQPILAPQIWRREEKIQQRLGPKMVLGEPHVKQTLRLASRVSIVMEPPCTSMSFAVC